MRRLRLLLLLAPLLWLAGCQTDLPLVDLKEKWGGPPSRFLPMDGMEVHWRDEGPGTAERQDGGAPPDAEAPAILLLHGVASSLHTWDGWTRRLSTDHRVVRLDLPGFGLTGPHPSGDYSGTATVDFLERFANAAGLKRFAIAGSSLGAYYAWRFALRHPERVTSLILIDAVGFPLEPSGGEASVMQLARMPIVSELMRFAPLHWVFERSLREVYADDAKVTPELVDRYEQLMLRPGNRAAFGDRTRAERRPVGWQRLPELKVRTLVMWGAQDPWLPLSHAERFRNDIPDSTLVVYPKLGHLPMEEDPESTARDARLFLGGKPIPGQK
jgi:pimeloyl-ACP methyl ester carboxylesterase